MTTVDCDVADFYLSVAAITNVNGQLLLVRKWQTESFILPGGKLEADESPITALQRELLEELGLTLAKDSFTYIGQRRAVAANEPGHGVQAHLFCLQLARPAVVAPQAEIAESRWFDKACGSRQKLAPLVCQLLDEAVI